MKAVHVSTGKPYDIFIERGILGSAAGYAKSLSSAEKITIVSDTNVAPLYLEALKNPLENAGFEVNSFVYEAGEKSKHLGTIAEIYNSLADFKMTRKDIIIALGGGVCGDMAGFAAASYLRGIDFIQIPTSLLSQVDSSVGGKTGVDLPQGKNLVGAFHQPIAVLIDPDMLKTLPEEFITDGMGEVIKYGCIKDAEFFEFLENENALENIESVIETCVKIKRDVVSRDEREKGERMLLNFGHTLGHAIEKLTGYGEITHGMAVAIGMAMIAKAGEKNSITEAGAYERIVRLCKKYNLPVDTALDVHDIVDAARSDKKSAGGSVNLVLLKKIGESFTRKIEFDKLEEFIQS